MNRIPNIDPYTLALGQAERFEMAEADHEAEITRLDRQARETALMHVIYGVETNQAAVVAAQRDEDTLQVVTQRIVTDTVQPVFVRGSLSGYRELDLPTAPPRSSSYKTSAQSKLCAVFDRPRLFVPRTSEEVALDSGTEIYVPVLSIRSIKRTLDQHAT